MTSQSFSLMLVRILLVFLVSQTIETSALMCYRCSTDKLHRCIDQFYINGYGVRSVNSSSGYCWKVKIEVKNNVTVVRDGNQLQDQYPNFACPAIMNTCTLEKTVDIKISVCCCQDSERCNQAAMHNIKLSIVFLSVVFIFTVLI